MKKFFFNLLLVCFLFSCKTYKWNNSEIKTCVKDRNVHINKSENKFVQDIFVEEFHLSANEISSCYCKKLEKEYTSYEKAKELIFANDSLSNEKRFKIGASCFEDNSKKGAWTKNMKNACVRIFELQEGLLENYAHCCCDILESYYQNLFEFSEAAKKNKLNNNVLKEFVECQ